MKLLWATRGRTWGFRFLRDAGLGDPLPKYDEAFEGLPYSPKAHRRRGDEVALRFPDPEGRRDAAGRVVPHEFVVFPPLSYRIDSVEAGLRDVWPLVKEEFEAVWDLPDPSSASR